MSKVMRQLRGKTEFQLRQVGEQGVEKIYKMNAFSGRRSVVSGGPGRHTPF